MVSFSVLCRVPNSNHSICAYNVLLKIKETISEYPSTYLDQMVLYDQYLVRLWCVLIPCFICILIYIDLILPRSSVFSGYSKPQLAGDFTIFRGFQQVESGYLASR